MLTKGKRTALPQIPKLLNSKLKNKRISKIYRKFEKTLNISERKAHIVVSTV